MLIPTWIENALNDYFNNEIPEGLLTLLENAEDLSLLVDVKNYLDITWDDPEGDKKLSGIISRGKRLINRHAGSSQDYTIEDAPRELLFDYCRYVRDNALDEFEENYRSELLALQIDREVEAYGGKE